LFLVKGRREPREDDAGSEGDDHLGAGEHCAAASKCLAITAARRLRQSG
jgi:hypothetical protein